MREAVPRRRSHAPPVRVVVATLLLHTVLLVAAGRWYGWAPPAPQDRPAAGTDLEFVRLVTPTLARGEEETESEVPATDAEDPMTDEEDEQEDLPRPADPDPARTTPASAVPPSTQPAGASPLRSGFTDPRLHVDPSLLRYRAAPASPSMAQRFRARLGQDDADRASRAQEERAGDQVTIFGRSVTLFGDSATSTWRSMSAVVSGRRMVLPTDGREWEEREMARQREEFVRDSILRARTRSAAEREQ